MTRHSTKDTVAIAQRILALERVPIKPENVSQLLTDARSLAGSVLSQADPED